MNLVTLFCWADSDCWSKSPSGIWKGTGCGMRGLLSIGASNETVDYHKTMSQLQLINNKKWTIYRIHTSESAPFGASPTGGK